MQTKLPPMLSQRPAVEHLLKVFPGIAPAVHRIYSEYGEAADLIVKPFSYNYFLHPVGIVFSDKHSDTPGYSSGLAWGTNEHPGKGTTAYTLLYTLRQHFSNVEEDYSLVDASKKGFLFVSFNPLGVEDVTPIWSFYAEIFRRLRSNTPTLCVGYGAMYEFSAFRAQTIGDVFQRYVARAALEPATHTMPHSIETTNFWPQVQNYYQMLARNRFLPENLLTLSTPEPMSTLGQEERPRVALRRNPFEQWIREARAVDTFALTHTSVNNPNGVAYDPPSNPEIRARADELRQYTPARPDWAYVPASSPAIRGASATSSESLTEDARRALAERVLSYAEPRHAYVGRRGSEYIVRYDTEANEAEPEESAADAPEE